jgi:predicted nucleotidyltransferase
LLPEREALKNRLERRDSELQRAVEILRRMGAERIVLIGSMAQDARNPYGDIDLVVVMQSEERFLDRLKTVYGRIQPSVAMDILVYTPDEFREMSQTSPFLFHALKGGKVLYAA